MKRKWQPLLLSSLILLSLVSCARMRPRACMAKPLKSQNVSALPEVAHDGSLFVKGDWPTPNWWETFHDPQLSSLMQKGLSQSPDLVAAKARARAALEVAKAQKSYLFPDLSLKAEDQWINQSQNGPILGFFNLIPETYNDIAIGLNLSYDIDLFGKHFKTYKAALGEAMASQVESRQAALLLSTQIASAYFQLQSHYEALKYQEALREETKTLFDLTEKSLEKGLSTEINLDSAAASLSLMDENVAALEELIQIEEHMLRVLIGEGPLSSTEIRPSWQYSDKILSLPNDIPLSLLCRRPDLRAKLWYIEATAYRVGAAKAEFLPNINLAALGGFETIRLGSLFSLHSLTAQVIPSVSLPLFNGGRLQANLDQASDIYEEAIADYNSTLLKAVQEIADQITTISQQKKQLLSEDKRVDLKEKDLFLRERQKTAGLATQITVSQAAIEKYQEKLQQIDLQNKQYLAYVKLLTALGGGF